MRINPRKVNIDIIIFFTEGNDKSQFFTKQPLIKKSVFSQLIHITSKKSTFSLKLLVMQNLERIKI